MTAPRNPNDPAPRKRRTVFATAGLSASAAVIAASLSVSQTAQADQDDRAGADSSSPDAGSSGAGSSGSGSSGTGGPETSSPDR